MLFDFIFIYVNLYYGNYEFKNPKRCSNDKYLI